MKKIKKMLIVDYSFSCRRDGEDNKDLDNFLACLKTLPVLENVMIELRR